MTGYKTPKDFENMTVDEAIEELRKKEMHDRGEREPKQQRENDSIAPEQSEKDKIREIANFLLQNPEAKEKIGYLYTDSTSNQRTWRNGKTELSDAQVLRLSPKDQEAYKNASPLRRAYRLRQRKARQKRIEESKAKIRALREKHLKSKGLH